MASTCTETCHLTDHTRNKAFKAQLMLYMQPDLTLRYSVFLSHSIYVCHMILKINRDYSHEQHQPAGVCNRNITFHVWYGLIFMYCLDNFMMETVKMEIFLPTCKVVQHTCHVIFLRHAYDGWNRITVSSMQQLMAKRKRSEGYLKVLMYSQFL